MKIESESKISFNCGSKRTIIPHKIAELLNIQKEDSIIWVLDLGEQTEYDLHIKIKRRFIDENNKDE